MRLHVRRVTIPTLPFVEPRKLLQIAVSLTFAVAKLRCAPRGPPFVLDGSQLVGWYRRWHWPSMSGASRTSCPRVITHNDKNAWARRTTGSSLMEMRCARLCPPCNTLPYNTSHGNAAGAE